MPDIKRPICPENPDHGQMKCQKCGGKMIRDSKMIRGKYLTQRWRCTNKVDNGYCGYIYYEKLQ